MKRRDVEIAAEIKRIDSPLTKNQRLNKSLLVKY